MFNIVILTGRVCQDLELKTTPSGVSVSGVSVTSFRIAVERRYKQGEERQADFINIVAWRSTAEFVSKYFKKGSMIGIEGSIQTRKYQDKDGNKRTAFEVVANNVQFVESKRSEGEGEGNSFTIPENDPLPELSARLDEFEDLGNASDDDLPF